MGIRWRAASGRVELRRQSAAAVATSIPKVTPHKYPKLLAADPSGFLLLLHAKQGRTMNAGHLGILASPAGFGSGYGVAELQTFVGDDHATIICFSFDVGEWVDKTVEFLLLARSLCTHGVIALHGRLWWIDLSWCLIACDPCADKPGLAVVRLPSIKEILYDRAAGVIDRYHAVRISAGRLR